MKLVYECPYCGAVYPGNFAHERGKFAESSGYGQELRCVKLVEARVQVPVARDSSGNPVEEKPLEVCGTLLVGRPENTEAGSRKLPDGRVVSWEPDDVAIEKLNPITPGKAKGL